MMSRPANEAAGSPPRPALQHSPQTQGTGSSRGNRARESLAPRPGGAHTRITAGSTAGHPSSREGLNALHSKGAAGSGHPAQDPESPECRRADTQYEVNGSLGKPIGYVQREPPKLGWPHMDVRGSSGPVPFTPCSARPLQALQRGAEPGERREGLGGEAAMLHHGARRSPARGRQRGSADPM